MNVFLQNLASGRKVGVGWDLKVIIKLMRL